MKDKLEHTPGLWQVEYKETRQQDRFTHSLKVINPSVGESHRLISRINIKNPCAFGNAHLIAAAPELLEACQAALKSGIFPSAKDDRGRTSADLLCRAIKKATGANLFDNDL